MESRDVYVRRGTGDEGVTTTGWPQGRIGGRVQCKVVSSTGIVRESGSGAGRGGGGIHMPGEGCLAGA